MVKLTFNAALGQKDLKKDGKEEALIPTDCVSLTSMILLFQPLSMNCENRFVCDYDSGSLHWIAISHQPTVLLI